MRVRVYWNLHRKVWSVKANRQPVRHEKELSLSSCKFLVWQSGRERVLREKRKVVHAFACGEEAGLSPLTDPVRVSYNPYKAGHFYRTDTGERVDGASRLHFSSEGQVFADLIV